MSGVVVSGTTRCSSSGLKAGVILLAAASLVALPAAAVNYGWGGSASSDWGTPANWQRGVMALTGGTFDATLYITNRTNNRIVYSAANGATIFTSNARCLRIADGANGSLAITGGILETKGSGDFVSNGAGNGLLLIDGGTYISTNNALCLGAYSSVATLTVSNGFARVDKINIWCSVGTVNLVNGTLGFTGMSLNGNDNIYMASMNLYGGTLQSWKSTGNASWMYPNTNWVCRLLGPVTFDTQANTVSNAASINGPGSITKIGLGMLNLNVSNTVGAITVNEGTLALGGSNTISSGVTLNAGTLAVNHAAALGAASLTVNGGRLDNSSGAAVVNVLNTPLYLYTNFLAFVGTRDLNLGTSPVTLPGSMVFSNGVRTLALGGPVSDGGSTNSLTSLGSGGLALLGTLSIGGRLMTAGGGTLLVAGANTYTGATTISASTLIAANNLALGATNAATSVADAGSLQLTNGIVIEAETVFLAGNGENNRGALQAANNSTGTWNGVVVLNDANNWTPRLGNKLNGVLIVNGPIRSGGFTGADHLFISGEPGNGRVVVAGTNNTYKGTTGILRGTLALGATNTLPVGTTLDLHPTSVADPSKFDLSGFSQTVAGFLDSSYTSGQRFVTNSSDTVSVLTVNQAANTIYYGHIDGNVSLVKDGSGSLTLAGTNNTYAGATVLNAGTLALGCDGALSASTAVTLAGGTLSIGAWNNAVQQLTVSGVAAIDLGDGTGRLAFADSSGQTWSGTLNLAGTFDLDAVRFGSNDSGLTVTQLGMIRIGGQRRWLALSSDGYLRERKGTVFSVQ